MFRSVNEIGTLVPLALTFPQRSTNCRNTTRVCRNGLSRVTNHPKPFLRP